MRGICSFGGKPGGHPVQLAGHVVVHLAEAQALEPPRGSRRHVSSGIPAVDNHRSRAVEKANRLRFKAPEREADRVGKVIFLVLFGGQNLDELGAAFDQLLILLPVDLTWHWLLAF
jgi:hypothetical protein